jgi:hypothetical protein
VVSRFTDAAHYLRWMGSHGGRMLLRHVPADRIDAAAADVAAVLDQARGDDGRLSLTTTFRTEVARS